MLVSELQNSNAKGLTHLTDVKVNIMDSSMVKSEKTRMGIVLFLMKWWRFF